jgi:hypothetical protein
VTVSSFDVASEIKREFPTLWDIATEFDFAERVGGSTEPLWAEADAALREIHAARMARGDSNTDTERP